MRLKTGVRSGSGDLARGTPVSRINARSAQTDVWGVTRGFRGANGRWHRTTPETRRALHAAMHADHDQSRGQNAGRR
jgi:hypothetical protein